MKEGERGQGRGPKSQSSKERSAFEEHFENLDQIEYLLFQSTQGVHFMFEKQDIVKVLSQGKSDENFFTELNMKKVQGLLSGFLDAETLQSKQSYLDRLPKDDFELLVRAYFHLVENTILAHSDVRH